MSRLLAVLLLLGGCAAGPAHAQVGLEQALQYDTLLAPSRTRQETGVTKRLVYQDLQATADNHLLVMYVYQRAGTYYLKRFTLLTAPVNRLLIGPEEVITAAPQRRACRRYFARVAHYQYEPARREYVYQPFPSPSRPNSPAPTWFMRVVQLGAGGKHVTHAFYPLNPHGEAPAPARAIRRWSQDLTRFRATLHF